MGDSPTGPPPRVDIWRIPLGPDADVGQLDELFALLDPDEQARAGLAARAALRRQFVLSHGVTRLILGRRLGVEPGSLHYVRGRWGKPAVAGAPELCFSLAHSGDVALVAVTGSGRSVGVDVEEVRSAADGRRLAGRFFPPDERDVVTGPDAGRVFTRLWTRKEACVKAAGVRLADGLPVPVAHLGNGGGEHLVSSALVHSPCGEADGPWTLMDLEWPDPGCAAAVVLAGDGAFRLGWNSWRFGGAVRPGGVDSIA